MSGYPINRLAAVCTAALVLGLASGTGVGPVKDPPAAPSDLAAAAGTAGRVLLSWKDNSDVETGYRVTRDPPFAEGAVEVPADTVQFEDYPGKGAFVYTVVSYNDRGDSAALTSDKVRVSEGVPGLHGPVLPVPATDLGEGTPKSEAGGGAAAPAAPTRLRLRNDGLAMVLDWSDRSDNEDGFEIQRESARGDAWNGDVSFRTGRDKASYSDAPAAGMYRYRVRAVNDAGASAFTGWVIGMATERRTGEVIMPPEPPSNPAVSDIGGGRAMVSWTDNSSNEGGFVIERNPAFVSGPVTVSANSTSFVDQTGNGTFRFRVRSFNAAGSSEFTKWAGGTVTSGSTGGGGSGGGVGGGIVLGATSGDEGGTNGGGSGGGGTTGGGTCGGVFGPGTIGPDGWTIITPSADSRIVYVSSSSGDDSNSGLSESTPKRSLVAAYNVLRDGYPDWMLLKRGDTWNSRQYASPSWHKCGRSHDEPMVLGSYGTGERPLINTAIWDGMDLTGYPRPIAHLAIMDIHMIPDEYDGANCSPVGICIINDVSDLLIENCKFERFFTGIAMQCAAAGQGHPAAISLRRDTIADCFRTDGAHAQGLFISDTDGLLLEECVLDHNGWRENVPGATPDVYRHNAYLTGTDRNVVIRGCISARSSNNGLMSRSGGTVEDNLSLDNPCGISVGDDEPGEQNLAGDAIVRRNVVLGSRTLGWGINAVQTRGLIIRDNIIAHQTRSNMQSVRGIQISQGHTDVEVASNIVFDWPVVDDPNGAVGMVNNASASGTFRIHDNILQLTTGGFVLGDQNYGSGAVRAEYQNNRYYTSNRGSNQFNYHNTFQEWMNWANDSGTNWGVAAFPDASRTISSYMQSISGTPALDAFLERARLQERGHWSRVYTAAAVNEYIRAGFGLVPAP